MKITFYSLSIIGLSLSLLTSCGGSNGEGKDKIDKEVLDPNSSLNTNFDGKIFNKLSDIPVLKSGFCFKIAERRVDPDLGSPDIK